MDNQQARFLLQSCRPDGRDADDPRFTEALEAAERDPELATRLADEQSFDLALASKLKSIPVPIGLREQLLIDGALYKAAQRRRQGTILALAASVVLLLSLAGAWFTRERDADSFASYRQEMIARLDGRVQFSFTSERPAELQRWLGEQRGVSGVALPNGLRSLPGIGCRTWTWNGRPAGLICFLVNGREAVHLLVVSRDAVPRGPRGASPTFAESGPWTTASWTEGDKVYLLAGKFDRATLERLL